MSDVRSWTLTDVAERVWLERLDLNPSSIAVRSEFPWSVRKRVLHGGLTDGVDIVEVDNGHLSFTVVPSRGMGLWRGAYNGNTLGWRSPVTGPVNPQYVNLLEQGGLGWLKGFDEWIVRCGLNSNGAPCKDIVPDNNGNPSEVDLTLHGQIANLPAKMVEVQIKPGPPTELTVIGVVDEAMLFCPQLRLVSRVKTVAGSNVLTVTDRVVNVKEVPAELELLYHCNFGAPFLEEGGRLCCPSLEVAPRDARAAEDVATYAAYAGPVPGFVEQCYWHDLASDEDGSTVALLVNADGDKGVALRYDVNQMPCFTQWKNTVGEREGYVTGLEPGTNYPNPKAFEREQGRVVELEPGESYTIEFSVEVHDTREGVAGVEAEIAELLGGKVPKVHTSPVAKWSQAD